MTLLRSMVVVVWREAGRVYLEPGEVAAMAAAVRCAVPSGEPTHPRDLLLETLADVLDGMTVGAGIMLATAPAAVVRRAAEAYLRPSDAATCADSRLPSAARSVRLA